MSKADEQMPLEIWTDINGHATRTQFIGGVKYIRAAEYDALREQNRVLREALQEIYEGRWTPGISCCYEDDARDIYPTREMRIRNIALTALTATSQLGGAHEL